MSDPYDSSSNDLSNNILVQKIIVGIISFVVSILFGVLPSCLPASSPQSSSSQAAQTLVVNASTTAKDDARIDGPDNIEDKHNSLSRAWTTFSRLPSRLQGQSDVKANDLQGDTTASTSSSSTGEEECVGYGLPCDNDRYEAIAEARAGEGSLHSTGAVPAESRGPAVPAVPPRWLSLATSFGGGVFLGTALLHMLPEASVVLDGHFTPQQRQLEGGALWTQFPRASLICCLGFMAVLALEELLDPHESSPTTNASGEETSHLLTGAQNASDNLETQTRHPTLSQTQQSNIPYQEYTTQTNSHLVTHSSQGKYPASVMIPTHNYGSRDATKPGDASTAFPDNLKSADRAHNKTQTQSDTSSFPLVAALSLHSLFDGLAVGTATSSSQVKAVAIAVLSHKPISAFALGTVLYGKNMLLNQQHDNRRHSFQDNGNTRNSTMNDIDPNSLRSRRSCINYYLRCARASSRLERQQSNTTSLRHSEVRCDSKSLSYQNSSDLEMGPIPPSPCKSQRNCKWMAIPKLTLIQRMPRIPLNTLLYIAFFSISSFVGIVIGSLGISILEEGSTSSNSWWSLSNSLHPSNEAYDSFTDEAHTNSFESLDSSSDPFSSVMKSSAMPSTGALVAAIFQSLAAGTFLYAATIEALGKDEDHDDTHGKASLTEVPSTSHPKKRAAAVFVGVILMAAVKLLEPVNG